MVMLMASARIGFSDFGWRAIPLPWLLMLLTRKFVVGMWLSQQLEYEADAMGAAISKAAGCSSDSIVAAMHRRQAVIIDLQYSEHKDFADDIRLQMQESLAALQQLVPTRQLPVQVLDSKQLADVAQLVEYETKDAPADVQEQAIALMAHLQHCLGMFLFVFKGLWDTRFSSHPYYMDRIKRVQDVLASLPTVAGSEEGMACRERLTALSSLSLSEYQAAGIWSQALASETCIDVWKTLQQVRSCPQDVIELVTSIGNLELYSQSAKDVAWGEAMARNETVQQLSQQLKDASWVL